MASLIKCPQCGNTFEMTDALKSQIENEISQDIKAKFENEKQAILRAAEETLKTKFEEKAKLELEDLKKILAEKQARVDEFRENELKWREEKRKLEDKEKDLELEFNRKIDAERKNWEELILQKADEAHRMKDLEKEKIINDLKKSLEEAQRKAQQGSQQLQGEVLELELEEQLRQSFPHDSIEPVEKGIRGADIKQVVKTIKGSYCGTILWESKRTKAWSNDWLLKLKEDLRTSKSNAAVLVTIVMPKEITKKLAFIEGVTVCDPSYALEVAEFLRQKLIDVARERFIAKNKESKAEAIYNYCTSQEFANQISTIYETHQEMLSQINKEKTVFEKIWKAREAQCSRILKSTAAVIGEMQGLVGQGSMPQFKELDILSLEPEN